jgi:hypothetical protein
LAPLNARFVEKHPMGEDYADPCAAEASAIGCGESLVSWEVRPKGTTVEELAERSRDAMTSAARRAHLYRRGLTPSERYTVRSGWSAKLTELAHAYVCRGPSYATQRQVEKDLLELRAYMNGHYAEFFPSTAIGGYAIGFRIAHAQKSLSLLLKYYWCNNAMSEPPLCPIDRRILLIAEARHAQAKWTDIDTMNDYRAKLAMLNVAKQSSMFAPIP